MDKKLSPAAQDLLTRILEDTFPSEFTCEKILEILRSEESVILGASSYGTPWRRSANSAGTSRTS